MTAFYIKDDFPKSEIEFDKRFATESACYDYLFRLKWPDGFICSKCGHQFYWISSKHIYICMRCESHFSLIADTIMMIPKNRSHTGLRRCGGLPREDRVSMRSIYKSF